MRHLLKSSVIATLAALGLVGCATFEPTAAQYAPPAVGTSWEVSQKSTGSYGSDARLRVARVANMTWQGKEVVVYRGPQTQTLLDPVTGRWLAITRIDGAPVMTFDPPMGWDHPVKVGNQYKTRQKVTMHALNRTVEFDQTCNVLAYEKVSVPAGTYDAFRVRCTTTAGHDETHWMAPALGIFIKQQLARSAANPSGPGTQDNELLAFTAGVR